MQEQPTYHHALKYAKVKVDQIIDSPFSGRRCKGGMWVQWREPSGRVQGILSRGSRGSSKGRGF